jgi:hypothetical protein
VRRLAPTLAGLLSMWPQDEHTSLPTHDATFNYFIESHLDFPVRHMCVCSHQAINSFNMMHYVDE